MFLTDTGIEFTNETMQELLEIFDSSKNKTIICTDETRNKYYEPAVLLDSFKGTAVETVLNTIPDAISLLAVIIQDPGDSYPIHTDIQDRYHLNIKSKHSYFLDFEKNRLIPIETDSKLYIMDTGIYHSATNYGNERRIQLGATKMLTPKTLKNPQDIVIEFLGNEKEQNFYFNYYIIPWMNRADKRNIVDRYVRPKNNKMFFTVEKDFLNEVENICNQYFKLIKL
jgi:hypothetical protein